MSKNVTYKDITIERLQWGYLCTALFNGEYHKYKVIGCKSYALKAAYKYFNSL